MATVAWSTNIWSTKKGRVANERTLSALLSSTQLATRFDFLLLHFTWRGLTLIR